MRFFVCMLLCFALLALASTHPGLAQSTTSASQLKFYIVSPKGQVAGVWISDGKSDTHITTEGNGFVIGRNPVLNNLKFTDPALIFSQDGIALQVKGEDGDPVWRPVSRRLARKLLNDMLDAAVKATSPAESRVPDKKPASWQKCEACDGTGYVDDILIRSDPPAPGEKVSQEIRCEKCNGTGKIVSVGGCRCGFGGECLCGAACECQAASVRR